jgi:two-component system response regulator
VLTTSNSEGEILEAYRRCCSGYVIKPLGFADFVKAVQALEHYWFALVNLPANGKSL